MHAYLFVGRLEGEIEKLREDLGAKRLDFPLQKIADARELNSIIKLSFSDPTLIVCENIHTATVEALNAFLKNLEEPQKNIYFALSTPSATKVLPTIVSRCQIIRVVNSKSQTSDEDEISKFLDLSPGEKLAHVDKIKDRGEAIKFTESMVFLLHSKLHTEDVKYKDAISLIESAQKTLTRLKANGNVNLLLSNLIINQQ